jgi:hypothetical protein
MAIQGIRKIQDERIILSYLTAPALALCQVGRAKAEKCALPHGGTDRNDVAATVPVVSRSVTGGLENCAEFKWWAKKAQPVTSMPRGGPARGHDGGGKVLDAIQV